MMMFSRSSLISLLLAVMAFSTTQAFLAPSATKQMTATNNGPSFRVSPSFAKKPKEDLSSIETRDMTREEMLELNAQNEDIMNMELGMMTAFSAVISLPILYLCWVAFFSE